MSKKSCALSDMKLLILESGGHLSVTQINSDSQYTLLCSSVDQSSTVLVCGAVTSDQCNLIHSGDFLLYRTDTIATVRYWGEFKSLSLICKLFTIHYTVVSSYFFFHTVRCSYVDRKLQDSTQWEVLLLYSTFAIYGCSRRTYS